ncbi:conjugal transfer protein TraD [Brucella intermedia]|uniref:conjugal transfer protein TraD n=1 Tax=Brucella intermedia TaxID=94625 RepID=UPI002249390F|nr:conjugal transfer protein TraD [Brucella intermedia]
MRHWRVERRKRTRHLIELGGLVVKAGIVDLTGDDRTIIYGAMIWIAEKLKSEGGEHARDTWAKLGTMGFEMDRPADAHDRTQPPQDRA